MRRLGLLFLPVAACTVPDSPLSDLPADASSDVAHVDTGGSPFDTGAASDVGGDASSVDGADAFDAPLEAGRDLGTDKSKFLGDPRCPTTGVLLCEDFESGALDTKTWTTVGTAPVIDGTQHARGGKALHISRTGNGSSMIKETKTFPAPKNKYFGRMFVQFHLLPTPPGMTFAHWTFVAASGTGVTGEIRLSGMLQSGVDLFGVGTDSGTDPKGTGDWTNLDKDPGGKPSPVPTDAWTCIEWMHDGEANETRFWWDGVEHPSMHTTASVHGGNTNDFVLPQFTQLTLGWAEYQTSTEPFESWVDEIIVDDERIGCVL